MRRKSTRILALLLSLVMLLSASYITAYARVTDYKTPQIDENGMYYFTYDQAGSWLMDTVDDLLGTIENGAPLFDESYVGIDIYIDLGSYELLCSSISSTWDEIDGLARIIGQLGDIDASALDNYCKRTDPQKADYNCVYTLLEFLYDNSKVLKKIVNGTFNFGILESTIYDIEDGMLEDLGLYLRKMLYAMLEEMTGREEGAEGSALTDTTYPKNGQDVDGALQDVVNWALSDSLGLAVDPAKVDIDISFYDLVSNLIEALLNSMVVPLLKDVIMDACDIDVTEEYPNGSPDENNNSTLNIVFGVIEGLMDKAESYPDYSNCTYPGEKVETLLTWFFIDGGIDQFILINSDGITIQDDFVDLLNKLIRLAIPLLHSLDGFDYLPSDYLYTSDQLNIEEGQPGYISNAKCYAQVVNILLSGLFMGYYCRPEADSISAIGAYALASLCARVAPELDYLDMLDANYTDNGYTAMPMVAEYTANGQYANGSSWTTVTRTYNVPYAAIDMGVTIGVYFLDGLITADFDSVPDSVADLTSTNTADAFTRFEKFLKVVLDWAVAKYAPLFENTFSLSTKYPNASDCWRELDEVLFSIIPSSWLPQYITDHTMDASVNTALGMNGTANIPMNSTLDLICGWLLGSVMDFDLQELFGLLQKNKSSNADLNAPTVSVILRLVDRVFYILCGKYCLLPEAGSGRDATLTNTSITNLNTLLTKENLGELVYNLCYALGGKGSSFNANVIAAPLLSTALPLLVSASYVKPFRTDMLTQGEITIGVLQNFIDNCGMENKCRFDYVPAEVDASTTGTYYTVNVNTDNGVYEATVTPVTLPAQYDASATYYTQKFEVAKNVDRFTLSDETHKYYKQVVSYTNVTLNGSNYDPTATYCSAEYAVANVTATTNGCYFNAQSAGALVSLPESYVEGTTYYTHPEVALGASDTGSYLKKNVSYQEVIFDGNGTNFVEGKNYYKAQQTVLEYDYMSAYDESTHKMSMGVYSSGDAADNGIGAYSTSIAGTNYYIFREQEDFPGALYTYNNFNDFIDDAEDFLKDYKNFLTKDVPEAHDEWAEYVTEYVALVNAGNSDGASDLDAPESMYMYYLASGDYSSSSRVTNMNLTTNYNNLQVIRDIRAMYGDSYMYNLTPTEALRHGHGASNSNLEIGLYKGYKEWIEELQKYSDGLNNYYDGINYYLSAAEQGRKSYTETSTTPLTWVLNLTAATYNNGENKDANGEKVYTDKTYEAFRKAYVAAQDVVSQVNLNSRVYKTTQSMVTKTRNGLIDAYYGLVRFGEKADLTQLYQYLVTARRIRTAEMDITGTANATYTSASFQSLCNILNTASDLYDTTPGSDEQETVDLIAAKLYAAINALVYMAAPGIEVKDDAGDDNTVDVGDSWVNSGITYGYIYGISEVTGYVFGGSDDSTFEVKGIPQDGVTYSSTSYGPGTGSSIVGKASGDVTKFRYTVILFGDINGDARIDGSDKTGITAYAAGSAAGNLDAVQLTAADVNGDGEVNASDAAAIQMVMEYRATINQAPNVVGTRVVMK